MTRRRKTLLIAVALVLLAAEVIGGYAAELGACGRGLTAPGR